MLQVSFKVVFFPPLLLKELELLNSVGAHIFTNTLRQLLSNSTALRHLRFQFVDTLNDEVGI